jgi:predicted dehydrogenase
MLRVAVIGCGLIGDKRANALGGVAELSFCYDVNQELSQSFALKYGCTSVESLEVILADASVSIVIIATRHDSLSTLALMAMKAGKHVFVEKPGGINGEALRSLLDFKRPDEQRIHIGYNHRHHRAIRKAINLARDGVVGEVLFLRARYGHGGRVGYEKEWRSDKELSGGGELIDQGSHLLDLSMAFLGDLVLDYGATPTYFWDMPVEDNAFMVVKNNKGAIGFLHASCTEWKNTFSLEIYGRTGKLEVSGLGGSYGVEKLTHFKMLPIMGPPETTSWEFPMADDSWKVEVEEFLNDIHNQTTLSENLRDSLQVMSLIDQIYLRTGR